MGVRFLEMGCGGQTPTAQEKWIWRLAAGASWPVRVKHVGPKGLSPAAGSLAIHVD